MDIEAQIRAWKKIELSANYAYQAGDFALAAKNYRRFLDATRDQLGPEDPNVLWIKRHYCEALMKAGRDAEADEVYHELWTGIDVPETEQERFVVDEVLQLRMDRASKLLAGRKREEALAVLEEAYEKSLEVFRSKHQLSVALRESRDNIRADLLRKQQKDLERKLRRKYEAEQVPRRDGVDRAGDLSTGAVGFQQAQRPEESSSRPSHWSAEIRSSGSSEHAHQDRHARDHLGAAERERLQLLALGAGTPEIRTPVQPSGAAGLDYDTSQKDSGSSMNNASARPRQSSTPDEPWGELLDDSYSHAVRGRPEKQEEIHKDLLSPKPRLVRQDTLRSRSVDLSSQNNQYAQARQLKQAPRTDFSDAALLSGTDEQYASTDNWFSMFLSQTHEVLDLVGPLKSRPGKRPRIAILDTGLNTKHTEVAELMKRPKEQQRIQGFWSPNEDLSAKSDEDGHGTHCAMIAHKVAPNADIYVARVFQNRKTVYGIHVAKAIRHAVKEWQVDIISMSFTISKKDPASNEEISQVISEIKSGFLVDRETQKVSKIDTGVLMFAAASNSGRNAGRTFPAKHKDVICVHSADGDGLPSKRNPWGQNGDENFSALGEFVEAPHKGQANERVSGSSVASAVAAGIAALVLEFSRQTPVDGQEAIQKPKTLNTKQGMEMVFLKMTDPDPRAIKTDVYKNLQPWYLLGVEDGEDDKAARKRIATDINKTLRFL